MAGTKAGGEKTKATILKRYGADYFKNIGSKGGKNGCGDNYRGGFAATDAGDRARKAGALGGNRSKRGFKYLCEEDGKAKYLQLNNNEIVYFNIDKDGKVVKLLEDYLQDEEL